MGHLAISEEIHSFTARTGSSFILRKCILHWQAGHLPFQKMYPPLAGLYFLRYEKLIGFIYSWSELMKF